MYYAATNIYSTPTSCGFANTWRVIGFVKKSMRDAFVEKSIDMATQAINHKSISNYGCKFGEISYYDKTGKYHEHMGNGDFVLTTHTI